MVRHEQGSSVQHAGAWGLARSARPEARLPVLCADGTLGTVIQCGIALTAAVEPEAVLSTAESLVPRLAHLSSSLIAAKSRPIAGSHLITGGTSGLGLLTGRWVAVRGACMVFLVSRSGAGAVGMLPDEWNQLHTSSASIFVTRCDTAEPVQVSRVLSLMTRNAHC